MLAITVNSVIIVIGGLIGLLFKKTIKKEIATAILKSLGIVVSIIGVAGVLKSVIVIEDNIFSTQYELLLIVSLSVGTVIGEILRLDTRVNRFGEIMEKKVKGTMFTEGFIDGILIFCIGAMSIVGSLEAASGDNSVLYLKASLDGITAIILTSTLGIGVIFASAIVFIYQSAIYGIAILAGSIMNQELINVISATGYILIVCLGFNFILKDKIKVVNMLPAIIISVIYYLIFL